MAGLREVTRACVGVNDCSYFTLEVSSLKSHTIRHFDDTLCPPQTEPCDLWATGHVERELKHSNVWPPSPLSSGVFGLQYQFSNTESLPVNTEALGRFFVSLRKCFSLSMQFRQGWLRWALQCPAPGAGVTSGCEEAQSWGQTHRCSFKLHLSQEEKFSFSSFWWIQSLKLIPS